MVNFGPDILGPLRMTCDNFCDCLIIHPELSSGYVQSVCRFADDTDLKIIDKQ